MKNHTVVWTNPWISIQWADLQNMVSGTSHSSLYNELLDAQAENIGRTIGYWYDFAKMPTETEISKNETLNISPSPVRIFITNAIRIEVMPECPPELFHVLIQGLKDHAWSGRWHNRLPCLWSYGFKKKLSRTGCNYQAEIQTRSLFALHVCVLQPQADFY